MALTTNLVSYWKLDESSDGSGAVTREDAHSTNDLSDNNTTASGTGIISNAADFELDNSESLTIADASQTGLDIADDISVSFWLNLESLPGNIKMYGLVDKTGDAPKQGYTFSYWRLDNDDFGAGTHYAFVCNYYNSDSRTYLWSEITLSTSTWYHIVMTVDVGATNMILYVDGTPQADNATLTNATAIGNSAQPFKLGRAIDGLPGQYLDGLLDEVGIWSRVLTSDEVTSLYNSGVGLQYPFTGGTSANHWLLMGV